MLSLDSREFLDILFLRLHVLYVDYDEICFGVVHAAVYIVCKIKINFTSDKAKRAVETFQLSKLSIIVVMNLFESRFKQRAAPPKFS